MSLLTRPPSGNNRQIKVSSTKLVILDPAKEFEAEENSPLLSLLFSSPLRPTNSYGALHDLVRMAQNFNRIKEETKSKVCCEFVDECLKEFSQLNCEQTNSLHLLSALRDRIRTLERLTSLVNRGSKSLKELRRLGFIHSNEPICREYFCERLCAVTQRWDAMVERGGDRSILNDEHYKGFNQVVESNIELASNFALLLFEETRGEWRFQSFDAHTSQPNDVHLSSAKKQVHLDNGDNSEIAIDNWEAISTDVQSEPIIGDERDEIQMIDNGKKTASNTSNLSLFDEFAKGLSLIRHRRPELVSKQSTNANKANPLFHSSPDLITSATTRGSVLLKSLLKREGMTFESAIQNWRSDSTQTLDDLDDALERHSIAILSRNEQTLLKLVRPHLIQHLESLRLRFILLQNEISIDSLSKIGRRVLAFNESLEMVDVESIFLELNQSIHRLYSLHQLFVEMHWFKLKTRDYISTGMTWNTIREVMIILSRILEGFSRLETFQWAQCVQTMNEGKTIARVLQGSSGYISTMLNLLVNDETRSLSRICQAGELLLDLNNTNWNEHCDRFQTCVRFFHTRAIQDSTLKHFFYF